MQGAKKFSQRSSWDEIWIYRGAHLFVLRLFVYLGLIAIAVAVVMFFFTRDVRYLRFAWQLFKFSLILLLVFAVLLTMGRLILYRA
jgi:hypothetical protein